MTKQGVRKITYVLLALLILSACFWGYGRLTQVSKRQVDILFLGDSIVGQYRDETSIPYLVGQGLGMTVYNGAFGGSCLSDLNVEESKAYQKDGLALTALARAIAYDDFRVQQTITIREPATEHFVQVVDELEQIDFDSLEYLVLEYGTNDYFAGVPITNPADIYDEHTFEGALRSSLEVLRKYLPDLQIILISPTYNWLLSAGTDCENGDFGGGYLKEYVDSLSRIAEEYGVAFLEIYSDFYPTGEGASWETYTLDGVHPNEAGRQKISEAICEFIKNN